MYRSSPLQCRTRHRVGSSIRRRRASMERPTPRPPDGLIAPLAPSGLEFTPPASVSPQPRPSRGGPSNATGRSRPAPDTCVQRSRPHRAHGLGEAGVAGRPAPGPGPIPQVPRFFPPGLTPDYVRSMVALTTGVVGRLDTRPRVGHGAGGTDWKNGCGHDGTAGEAEPWRP